MVFFLLWCKELLMLCAIFVCYLQASLLCFFFFSRAYWESVDWAEFRFLLRCYGCYYFYAVFCARFFTAFFLCFFLFSLLHCINTLGLVLAMDFLFTMAVTHTVWFVCCIFVFFFFILLPPRDPGSGWFFFRKNGEEMLLFGSLVCALNFFF